MTRTRALAKLYEAIMGEKTRRHTIADILLDLANNWSGGSGGGGGGGSSDFSIATVTVASTLESANQSMIYVAQTYSTADINTSLGYNTIDGGQTEAFEVILYKGKAAIEFDDGTLISSVSGDAEKLDDVTAIVTGNCTVNVAARTN